MMYLRLIVKILLPVMSLNMANKTQKTSMNTRNSDFRKNRENRRQSFFAIERTHSRPSDTDDLAAPLFVPLNTPKTSNLHLAACINNHGSATVYPVLTLKLNDVEVRRRLGCRRRRAQRVKARFSCSSQASGQQQARSSHQPPCS